MFRSQLFIDGGDKDTRGYREIPLLFGLANPDLFKTLRKQVQKQDLQM